MQAELIVLRLIHILGGVFWVGSALFMTFFLLPAMQKAGGAAAGQIMAGLQQRRMMVVTPIAAVLTMLSGLRMWWIVGGGMHYFQHRSGHTFAISGFLAILSFVIGMMVSRPAGMRVGELARSLASSDETSRKRIQDEMANLQRRATVSGYVVVVLLLLAAAGMAVARYL